MPIFEAYISGSFSSSGNTVSLAANYDPATDVLIEVIDDDNVFDGDLNNDEDGNDSNQFGIVTDLDGNFIAGGPTTTIYAEQQFNLVAPDGSTITLYQVEVDSDPNSSAGSGIFVGFLPTSPLIPGVTYTFTSSNTTPTNNQEFDDIIGAVCFTPGTKITTPSGDRLIEDLKVGDLVITADNGIQTIRWVGRKKITGARLHVHDHLRPVKIKKGAFGKGLPNADMWLSPHHRVLISGHTLSLHYGTREALAPIKGLSNDHSIFSDYNLKSTEYIHILFDKHEIVYSNGIASESFHPGAVGLNTIEEASRNELFEVFPELAVNPYCFGASARKSLKVTETRVLYPRFSSGAQRPF